MIESSGLPQPPQIVRLRGSGASIPYRNKRSPFSGPDIGKGNYDAVKKIASMERYEQWRMQDEN
jgi:hypothetical protein